MGGQRHAPASLPQGRTRCLLYRRLGRPQGRSGRVRKTSPPTGIRSPDRPARSESLYRLSYPGPQTKQVLFPNTLTLSVRSVFFHSLATCHTADHHSDLTVPETVVLIVPTGIIAYMYYLFLQLEFCDEMYGLACTLEVSLISGLNNIFQN